MKTNRPRPIQVIIAGIALCMSCVLGGCKLVTPSQPGATYTIVLPNASQQRIIVRATLTGLGAGATDLVMLRQWGGYAGLSDQLSWLRIGGSRGAIAAVDPHPAPVAGLEQDVVRWSVDVPRDGTLQLEYSIDLAGDDGAVPSRVWSDHALLLTRSLFVFPGAWLADPHAPLGSPIQVAVQAPAGWPVYAIWPSNPQNATYTPRTLEDLLDAALALGHYDGYELRDDTFHARILLPPTSLDAKLAERRAGDVGQDLLTVYRFFGAAPDPAAGMDAFVVVVTDDRPSAKPDGMALTGNTVLACTNPSLSAALDETVLRAGIQLWAGGAIRTAPRWSPQVLASEAWFTQGWADYLAWRIPFEAGKLSRLQYWDQARQTARALAANPATATRSLADAATGMQADPALAQLVHTKGYLGAMLLDQRLRSGTQSAGDLRTVLQRLHQNQSYYRNGALASREALVHALNDVGGADYALFVTGLMQGVGMLDLSSIEELAGPPAGEARAFVAPDGVRMVYQWVDGPAQRSAIYLSGGPGQVPYDAMYALSEALQPYLDVAYLDQRGCGRSDRPGQGAYSIDAYVNDIELLREQLGANKVVLIGHAWGGYCAINYAMRYPERVDALILLAPVPSFPRLALAGVEGLTRHANKEIADAATLRTLAQKGVQNYTDLVQLNHLLTQAGAYGGNLDQARASAQKAYAYYVKVAVLPEGVPLDNAEILPTLVARDRLLQYDLMNELTPGGYAALILYGAQDQVISRGLVDPLGVKLKADTREVPDAGHYLYLDNPRATLAEITAFLKAHP
jgi:proline iminopeptidase